MTLFSESEFGNLTAGEFNLDNQCRLNFLFWCNTATIWIGWTMLNEEKNRKGGEGRGWITKGIILTANRSSLKGNVVISGKTCSRRFLQLGLSMK